MKRLLFLSLFLMYLTNSFSQSDFRPGYYITNNNDTIRGLINYRGDILNSKSCLFKKDENSEVKEFLPDEISGYRFVDSKYYVSKKLPNDSAKQTVFMEYLIKGKVSVFYRRTHENERMFIEKDGKLAEMNNDESIITDIYQDKYYKPSNQYKGVLMYYFQEAPALKENIQTVEFNRPSLIKISKKYHEKVCNGEECIIYEKKNPKIKFNVGFYIGSGLSKLDLSYPSYFTCKLTSSPMFGGLFVQSNIPSVSERLFLQLKGGYSAITYKGNSGSNEINLKQSSIISSISLLYKLPNKKFRPNVSIGYSYNSLLKTDYSISTDVYPLSDNFIGKKILGPNAGIGFEIPCTGHLSYHLSINYETGITFINHMQTSKYQNFTLSTGIIF